MNVKCKGDYYADPATRFFIWKGEVKTLPDTISPEMEMAIDQGLLVETKEQVGNNAEKRLKDEVNNTKTLKG